MKKKTFFRGLATSFAVATLGLTSVALTSCEKESLSVQPSDVNNTYNFNYSELASYLNQWGIASEASLQKVLSSQLTKAQVEEILNNWDPSYQTLKDYLDNNYKPELENIKNILDAWNPTLTQLQSFLDAWDEVVAKIDGISNSLDAFFTAWQKALTDASATIFITVYDWDNGTLLAQESMTVEADAEGKIAQQIVEVECPYFEGYFTQDPISVTVPAVGKNQSVILPITFYLTSIESSGATLTLTTTDDSSASTEVKDRAEEDEQFKMSEEDVNLDENQTIEVPITVGTGTKVDNIDEINEYIDNMIITRAITDDQIRTTLKQRVALLNNYKEVETTTTVEVIKGSVVTVTTAPYYTQVIKNMHFEIEDFTTDIPVILKTVTKTEVKTAVKIVDEEAFVSGGGDPSKTESISHTGNAHGTGANAGGGTASK